MTPGKKWTEFLLVAMLAISILAQEAQYYSCKCHHCFTCNTHVCVAIKTEISFKSSYYL